MRTIYIDSGFMCHTSNPNGAFREVETELFDGKCDAFIEGCIYIPRRETYTRSDGIVFHGEMRTPWKPYDELEAAQRKYEREKQKDAENALAILLGGEST